jgi:ABC-type dipeptide/oligopeptide/nickel transport system permease component
MHVPSIAQFLVRRLLAVLATFLVITAVLFAIVLLAPVEARAELYQGRRVRANLPPEIAQRNLEAVIERHGMRDPYPLQYARWLGHVVRGDWGWSPVLRADVLDSLLERTPATLELTLYSLLLFVPLGLASGAIAGWQRDRSFDRAFRLAAFVGTSIPPFVLGLVLLSILYVGLHWFLPGYLGSEAAAAVRSPAFRTCTGLLTVDALLNGRPDIALDAARHLALPVLTLSAFHWATLGRVTRATIIEEVPRGYITAAHARGLAPRRVLWGHAVPNVLVPSLTSSAIGAASLLTGVYVIEIIFGWPGVSKLITQTNPWSPDVALAAGFAVYSVLAVLSIMILLDILQAIADPRFREGREGR